MTKKVMIKNGKIYAVKDNEATKKKVKAANDIVRTKAANENYRLAAMERKLDKLLGQNSQSSELDELMEALNKIPCQGSGGTCTVHPITYKAK